MTSTVVPQRNALPALAALDTYPWLRAATKASLQRQSVAIFEHAATFTGRSSVLSRITQVVRDVQHGLITLEAPPGSGVTTLLAYLAATHPYAFWFRDDDAGQGGMLLHAQLIAQHHVSVTVISPTANSHATALERVLEEVAPQHSSESPLVILIDPPASSTQPQHPHPMIFPAWLPPHVIIIYGCTPAAPTPLTATARITLPQTGDEVVRDQTSTLQALKCPPAWHAPIIAASQGNFLYLRLAHGLLRRGTIDVQSLPADLEALHTIWWNNLDDHEQRLMLLLAAAGAPIPIELCQQIVGVDVRPLLTNNWGWVDAQKTDAAQAHYQLHHWTTQDYIARQHASALAQTHAAIVALSDLQLAGQQPASGSRRVQGMGTSAEQYLMEQAARHAALGPQDIRTILLPHVTTREWVHAHERHSGNMTSAARDLAWALHCAVQQGSLLRLIRSTALAGTLSSLARTLAPDAAVAAFSIALEQNNGRESGLRRVLTLVNQLPDGRDKALVLRQLGEACYGARMRTSAMRLLSQALDLEEQTIPRVWREQREQLYMAMANTALYLGSIEAALDISARIEHRERRGMAATNTIRQLLERGNLDRAQEIASTIEHESLAAWAQAEVAVALARSANLPAAEKLLSQVTVETANAWAQIELACDDATRDEDAAHARINRLASATQRDRGLTRLAHALALADKDGDALHVASQISDIAVRVTALLDLRLTLEGLVAMLALEQATSAIEALTGDARVPLVAALAAAHAALGRRERAIGIAQQLAEGEERDRALSRVAIALARWGDYEQGKTLAQELADDDERDWTLDELTRILANSGHWQDAYNLGMEISAEELRAHALAELTIAQARTYDPVAALQIAQHITVASERIRALIMMAPTLVVENHVATALAVAGIETGADAAWTETTPIVPHIFTVDTRSRYLATLAIALAEQSQLSQAQEITRFIARPVDRARVYLAIAQAAVAHDHARSQAALGTALQTAILGRDEAFWLLEQAVPVLASLEGAPLLTRAAAVIDELDSW